MGKGEALLFLPLSCSEGSEAVGRADHRQNQGVLGFTLGFAPLAPSGSPRSDLSPTVSQTD